MQDVRNLFERHGVKYHELDEDTVLAGFQGDYEDLFIGARLQDDWLTLTVPNYFPPVPDDRKLEVYEHLLELNARIHCVRFALDEEGQIMLMADVAGYKRLEYSAFADAIDALGFYANDVYPYLYKLITGEDPSKPEESANG